MQNFSMAEIERFDWNSKNGPKKLWMSLNKNGVAWFRMPGAANQAKKDRHQFVQSLLNVKPLKVEWFEVKVIGGTSSYRTTNKEALFHADVSSQPQPDLQIMTCQARSKKGGQSRFVDTWKILDEIEKKEPSLYPLLFTRERPIFSIGNVFWSPTYHLRNKNFVCTHVPEISESDSVGKSFLNWVNRQKAIELQMEPDDVYVANNLRMLHARTAFTGKERLYYRMLTTLSQPLECKTRHAKRAQKVAQVFSKFSEIFKK